ncbi:hypothetical protein AB1Y20_013645 [Prymnesium parvum]|uniref:Derlin n=1 Tax=Prymnesium parvum TaxID=97485 RepID=A0AB34IG41_PRYPA
MMISTPLAQVLLYTNGPFYAFPWRAPLNFLLGSDYPTAFRHFDRDHKGTANLSYHLVCLVATLLCNFALLRELDALLLPRRAPLLQIATATSWGALLLAQADCPPAARAAAAGCAALLWAASPLARRHWRWLAVAQSLVGAAAVELITCVEAGVEARGAAFTAVLLLQLGMWYVLRAPSLYGKLAPHSTYINGVALAWMCALAMKANPVRGGLYAQAAFLLWPLSFLSAQPWLCLLGVGFSCSIAQGVAHRLGGEPSTVEQLQSLAAAEKLQYEWAHHTFFPNLVFHAIYNKM